MLRLVVLVILFALSCFWFTRKKKKEFWVLRDYYDAEEALIRWRSENPDALISESTQGRWLLMRRIETYELLLKNNPQLENDDHFEYLEYLYSLLDGNDSPNFLGPCA